MKLLSDLNPTQRQAVELTDGAMLILAGAGSGKTRVIAYKIAYLIEKQLAKPEEILGLTFTNKAAQEMRERVSQLVRQKANPPWISTFHALGARLLRRHINELKQNYNNNFTIFDEADQISLIKLCIQELGYGSKSYAPQKLLSGMRRIKKSLTSGKYEKSLFSSFDKNDPLPHIFKLYQQKLMHYNALDFDDLLLKTIELLTQVKGIRNYYQEKFRYCLVDEFQDTNRLQYLILKLLVDKWKNICAVGDDDQSIYRWRGADINNMLDFEKDFPESAIIKLQQNYRSTKNILKAANSVIQHNTLRKDKSLWTKKELGAKIHLYQAEDEREEARIVVDKILSLKREYPLEEIAVLYRTNFQSRPFEEALRRLRIPYKMVGSVRFFERKEVKDILSYLCLLVDPSDDISLKRIINIPHRGIGKKTLAKLEEYAKERKLSLWESLSSDIEALGIGAKAINSLKSLKQLIKRLSSQVDKLSLSRLIRMIIDKTDYLSTFSSEDERTQQNRLENLKELIAAAKGYEELEEEATLPGFLDQVHLTSDHDYYQEAPSVTLMTLHCAKGLEFSVVFIVGLEEGLCPHRLSQKKPEELEEERRLCYVGMTRAKDRLFLSYCLRRREFEDFRYSTASRFIEHIPAHLIERREISSPQPVSYYSEGEMRKSLKNIQNFFAIDKSKINFKQITRKEGEADGITIGCDVIHPQYGRGTVLDLSGSGETTKISIYFPSLGKKKFILKYARLKKV